MDDVKTFGIKLSEIRPCDSCGGKLVPPFRVVDIRIAVFNPRNVNAVMGLMQMWGGRGLGVAEAMAPGADNAVDILDEDDATTRLYICQDCMTKPLELWHIADRLNTRKEKSNQDTAGVEP